jgi:hypothetical protein
LQVNGNAEAGGTASRHPKAKTGRIHHAWSDFRRGEEMKRITVVGAAVAAGFLLM